MYTQHTTVCQNIHVNMYIKLHAHGGNKAYQGHIECPHYKSSMLIRDKCNLNSDTVGASTICLGSEFHS